MKKKIQLLVLMIFLCTTSFSQHTKNFRIAFYNVENLFDTIDDPKTNDNDFLPSSTHQWNTQKYNTKIKNLSNVIAAMSNKELPEIVGLCEVENEMVLEDLINSNPLKNGNYKIIHSNSEDPRGIDIALIYRPNEVNYLNHNYIRIPKNDTMKLRTRDILYFKYTTIRNDTVHLFVNHWPSRLGGEANSEPKRIWVAQTLKFYCDSIYKSSPNAALIITGDFNDYPTNKSISEVLNATGNKKSRKHKLLNLMYSEYINKKGTYYFNKEWGCLDQFIVSFSIVRKTSILKLTYKQHQIFSKDWLLQTNNKGETLPFKTFNGKNYAGGYSDHLPILLDFRIK
ncbi:MAG: hypothetical protein KJZ56_11985 [Flavobacteriales bacterium]|nr:hypothetical protein [Flavobacteriales bacterium]